MRKYKISWNNKSLTTTTNNPQIWINQKKSTTNSSHIFYIFARRNKPYTKAWSNNWSKKWEKMTSGLWYYKKNWTISQIIRINFDIWSQINQTRIQYSEKSWDLDIEEAHLINFIFIPSVAMFFVFFNNN